MSIPATLHAIADALTALEKAYQACEGSASTRIYNAEVELYRAIYEIAAGQVCIPKEESEYEHLDQ